MHFQNILRPLILLLVLTSVFGLAPIAVPVLEANTNSPATALKPDLAAQKETGDFGCLSGGTSNMFWGCAAWASYGIMSLAAWAAGLAAVMLNFSVSELIVGMGQLVGEMPAIVDCWILLRDIANVFLVFITIFIGVAIILGISNYHYKKLLWKVLLAALFVNFSMFFTKIIIDVSNLAATELYTILLVDARQGEDYSACSQQIQAANFTDSKCISDGIAGAWWGKLKLMSVMSYTTQIGGAPNNAANTNDTNKRIVYIGALGTVLFVIMTFVFGAAALLLIARFVILVFLMIMSPVAFVAWITGFSNMGSRWWHRLLNEAFFAPAIFLMFLIAWRMTDSLSDRYIGGMEISEFSKIANGEMGAMSLLLYFIIIAGFLIGGLMIARSLGATGASSMMSTGKQWSKAAGFAVGAGAGAATAGAAGWAGRRFIGGGARIAAESDALKNFSSKNKFTRFIGTSTRSALSGVAKSSMDVRNAPVISKTASKYLGAAGGKGGYDAWAKRKSENLAAENKWIGSSTGSSEQRRQRDVEMAEVNKAKEQTKSLDVQRELDRDLNSLDKDIVSLAQAIEAERASGLQPERIPEMEQKLTKLKQEQQGRVQLKTDIGVRNETMSKLKNKNLSTTERAELERKLSATTASVHKGYKYVDPELERLGNELKEQEAKLAQTQNKDERKVLQASIARNQQSYSAAANMHDFRQDIERDNPEMSEAQVLAALDKAAMAQRTAIDAQHAKEWATQGKERAAVHLDQVSTETNFGMPMPDWRRNAVASIRKTGGKSEMQLSLEKLQKIFKEQGLDATGAVPTGAGAPGTDATGTAAPAAPGAGPAATASPLFSDRASSGRTPRAASRAPSGNPFRATDVEPAVGQPTYTYNMGSGSPSAPPAAPTFRDREIETVQNDLTATQERTRQTPTVTPGTAPVTSAPQTAPPVTMTPPVAQKPPEMQTPKVDPEREARMERYRAEEARVRQLAQRQPKVTPPQAPTTHRITDSENPELADALTGAQSKDDVIAALSRSSEAQYQPQSRVGKPGRIGVTGGSLSPAQVQTILNQLKSGFPQDGPGGKIMQQYDGVRYKTGIDAVDQALAAIGKTAKPSAGNMNDKK